MSTTAQPIALSKTEFTNFTLTDVKKYNHNSNLYTFSFPDHLKDRTAGGPVTHCIMCKAPDGKVVGDDGKDIARPYTPISSVDLVGKIEFVIKEYPTGKISPFLASLKIGDQAAFKGPFPKFPYVRSALKQGVCVSGGSGITPMYQLISHALSDKTDTTKWVLLYANVTEEDILLREEWDRLVRENPDRLKVVYALDKPPQGWTGITGYISDEAIKKEALGPEEGDKVKVLVCGPPPMYDAVCGGREGPIGGAVTKLGYSTEQVFRF